MGANSCKLCSRKTVEVEAVITDCNFKNQIIETISNMEIMSIREECRKALPLGLNNFEMSFQKPLSPSKYFKTQYKVEEKLSLGEIFSDSTFLPEQKNISYIEKDIIKAKKVNKNDIEYLSNLSFMCLFEVFKKGTIEMPSNFQIFLNSIDFGFLGNRTMMTSILFLTWVNPNFSFILTQVIIETKLFEVRLFIQGQPKTITIDSQIPVIKDISSGVKKPGFILTSDLNFWVLLIEKAIAKVSKGYGNTIRYLASEVYPLITEIPLISIEHYQKNYNKIWSTVVKSTKKNWITFCEIAGGQLNGNSEESKAITLENEFTSFFIIKAFEIGSNKYLDISVPFLKEDDPIRELFKSKFECEDINNETYFPPNKKNNKMIIHLNFDFFFYFFNKTFILKYEKDYQYNYNRYLTIPGHTHVVKVRANKRTRVTFTMHLEEEKFNTTNYRKQIPLNKLFLAKISYDTNNLLSFVTSQYTKQVRVILESELEEGDYYLFYKLHSEDSMNVIISTYSDNKVIMTSEDSSNTNFINNFNIYSRSLFNSFLEKYGQKTQFEDNPSLKITSSSQMESDFGYKVLKIENTTEEEILNYKITYKELTLISHKERFGNDQTVNEYSGINTKHFRQNIINDTKEFSLTINPQTVEVIVFEYPPSLTGDFVFSSKFEIEKIREVCSSVVNQNKFGQIKTFLKDNLYYFEIKFKKSIYLFIVNDSDYNFGLSVFFSDLENVKVVKPNPVSNLNRAILPINDLPNLDNLVKVDLKVFSKKKEYILLKGKEAGIRVNYSVNFMVVQI